MKVNLSYECIERLDQIRETVAEVADFYPDLSDLIESIVFSVDLIQFRDAFKRL